jgi:2-dehydropantoate 2-reductase
MNIVLVGPGAMGCLFAGLLTEHLESCEVCLLDNDVGRAEAIAQNGIRIDAGDDSRLVTVNITVDPSVAGPADLMFICVKAFDTLNAMRYAAPAVAKSTAVVSLQNGLGNVDRISEIVDRSAIVRGVTSYGSTLLGTGHVRHAGEGPTLLAPVVPAGSKGAVLAAETLNEAGIDAQAGDNWLELVWRKLVVNAAINPLAAISDVANGRLVEDEGLRGVLRAAAIEAAAVAKAKGVEVADPVGEVERVCLRTAGNIASMLQDVRNGHRTEIESISGAVVREARALGIPVPTNEMLLTRVREMTQDVSSAGRDTA